MKRGKRMRISRRWLNRKSVGDKPEPKQNKARLELSESEFVEFVRELTNDPKWKKPATPWDEHTFRVGVQIAVKQIIQRNAF